MSRRGKNRRDIVDGVLLLNKPAGLSSNQALQRVKYALNARKAGHTGSLDPAATGMLPLCFGEATKVSAFLLGADKTYRVVASLGERTDSGDATGNRIESADVPALGFAEWERLLGEFIGETMQVPPMYSALKKDGKRLYELARRGEEVEREPRPITVYEAELLECAGRRLVFRVRCSKGTYIRTLVEDLAAKAGTVAYTQNLHRESVGCFDSKAMIDVSRIERAETPAEVRQWLISPDQALLSLDQAHISREAADRFCGGQPVPAKAATNGLVRVYRDDDLFLGVGELAEDGMLAPKRVFSLSSPVAASNSAPAA
ncbi:MAG: tRNA pseudouridine(55) synthase TruB [Woeseiaceae bacterium]|nr:tRNA pseudouridine(55) synthase TruB [Woeseiaceae bacterium]